MKSDIARLKQLGRYAWRTHFRRLMDTVFYFSATGILLLVYALFTSSKAAMIGCIVVGLLSIAVSVILARIGSYSVGRYTLQNKEKLESEFINNSKQPQA